MERYLDYAPENSIGMFACMTCTAPCTPMLPSMLAMNCTEANILISLHKCHVQYQAVSCLHFESMNSNA